MSAVSFVKLNLLSQALTAGNTQHEHWLSISESFRPVLWKGEDSVYASVTLKELEVETLSHIRPTCGKESSFSAGVSWRGGKHPSLTISPGPQRGCHFSGLLRCRALFSLVREPNHGPDLFSSTAVVAVCSYYCSCLSHYWWVMVMDSPTIVSVGSIPWGQCSFWSWE